MEKIITTPVRWIVSSFFGAVILGSLVWFVASIFGAELVYFTYIRGWFIALLIIDALIGLYSFGVKET